MKRQQKASKCKKRSAQLSPQRLRRVLMQRWLELAADIEHLARALRACPPGVFDADRLENAAFALEQDVWGIFMSDKPGQMPPSSPSRRERRRRELLAIINQGGGK